MHFCQFIGVGNVDDDMANNDGIFSIMKLYKGLVNSFVLLSLNVFWNFFRSFNKIKAFILFILCRLLVPMFVVNTFTSLAAFYCLLLTSECI